MINKVSWYRVHSFTVEESIGFKSRVFHKSQLRSLIRYLAAKPRLRDQLRSLLLYFSQPHLIIPLLTIEG